MNKSKKLTAVSLRAILSTLIVLLIIVAGVGFYFAQSMLNKLAITVSDTVAQSKNSDSSIQSLNNLQQNLTTQQDIVAKTNTIFSSAATFQTQAVKDLIAYAATSGVTISNYTFPAASTSTTATTASVPTTQVTITLTSPVNYKNLLSFMTAIEGNLPKMQIIGLNLGRVPADTTSVRIDQLTVAVYTR
jgi:predicted PurR-regulated permease PerM